MKPLLIWLILLSPALGAEMTVSRDLPYLDGGHVRQRLDVYSPARPGSYPIVFWIHGGGWRQGDKRAVQHKPQASVDRGYVFVSANYRLAPEATIEDMTSDLAQAIAWVRTNISRFQGDPERIVIAGHSAGAHLAALLCTNLTFLEKAGVPAQCIKGCVPVDTAVYDVPRRMSGGVGPGGKIYEGVFGREPELQKARSPVSHLTASKQIPPFLILHVADRVESTEQSRWFAEKLTSAGYVATLVPGEGKTHGTINTDLGQPDDPPTRELFRFLEQVFQKPSAN